MVRLCPNCKIITNYVECFKCTCCGYEIVKEYINLNQYFGANPYNDELHRAADDLLIKVNSLLQELEMGPVIMTSGYRTKEHNAKIGGSPNSNHCTAQAIDLADNDKILRERLLYNPLALMKRGMAMEDPAYCETKTGSKWIHLQSVLPKSGKTVFIPYAGLPVKK